VDRPGGAATSIAKADQRDVDLVGEVRELLGCLLALLADAVAREPGDELGAFVAQQPRPFVDDPLERPPGDVVPEPDDLAGQRASVGTGAELVLRWRGGGIQHGDPTHRGMLVVWTR